MKTHSTHAWKSLVQKNDSYDNLDKYPACFNKGHASAMKVHIRADQLLPQLLIEQFNTLPSHYMHIVYLHEEV